ncbi:MAG: PD40 domain-containing protein [Pyrinomonadaceae bacterium]|nr:PD40 domain-containing protein [Pyrinomonadaceae bacterium]
MNATSGEIEFTLQTAPELATFAANNYNSTFNLAQLHKAAADKFRNTIKLTSKDFSRRKLVKLLLNFCTTLCLSVIFASSVTTNVFAQSDSVVGQISSSPVNSFARDISGDGRFVVFESGGDLATDKSVKNNADGNIEIFLFDYAQRRIFQITNTKSALANAANSSLDPANIRVLIINTRPTISNDGRFLAFHSNATTTVANNTNPGSFDGNATGVPAALEADGNTEVFLYQIPATAPFDLTTGAEAPLTDLSLGTFTQATNSTASRPPVAGSTTNPPVVRDDNRDAALNDNGSVLSFVSTRDLVMGMNAGPEDNSEIFVYLPNAAEASRIKQITRTGLAGNTPLIVFNANPTVSADGLRVAFISTGNNPVIGASGGDNPDFNEEIFYANIDVNGDLSGTAATRQRQVTKTTSANGVVVNLFSPGRRISRDGNLLAFESLSDNPISGGTNQNGYGTYVYDATTNTARLFAARGDADSSAMGGDLRRFPTFSDYNNTTTPQTLVFTSRLNFIANGTISAAATEGLNTDALRPVQIYSVPLAGAPTLTRISRFAAYNPNFGLADSQPLASNSSRRIAFNLPFTELGGGNFDFSYETYYLYTPASTSTAADAPTFATGASNNPIAATFATGASPGLLTTATLTAATGLSGTITAQGASQTRSFVLPIELGGVSVTVNNAAAGIYSINSTTRQISFVVPIGTVNGTANVVINDNGKITRTTLVIIGAQPDIFLNSDVPASGGRARVRNIINRVPQPEPFTVTAFQTRPRTLVPTRLRVFITGVQGAPTSAVSIRIGTITISGAAILALTQTDSPGIYAIDFTLPATLKGAGDVPIVVTLTAGTTTFVSRQNTDTNLTIAPRIRIL